MRGPRSHCDGLFIPRVIWIIARGERCWCCLWEWEFLFPSLSLASLLSDHTSPARSHRPLRITLTNSTPRQTDKCLHWAGAAPAPVFWHIKGGIQMTNSCHLLWRYVTWWRPCHEWQTSQWCGSWDSVNWKWEIKSRISQWMQVSKFSRIINFLNTECVMA